MGDMVEKSKITQTRTAYGKTLDVPIGYSYKWNEYPDGPTLVAAKDELTIDEQVKQRNIERQSKARQAALSAALLAAGIVKPTAENDEQVRLRDMEKTLLTAKLPDGSAKYTKEQAHSMAEDLVGATWDEYLALGPVISLGNRTQSRYRANPLTHVPKGLHHAIPNHLD